MASKEKNFVSAVIYMANEEKYVRSFLSALTGRLSARFQNYELIFVNDASKDATEAAVKSYLQDMETSPPVTMIHMSLQQGRELAMNAGIDMAIGDFVYEFDTMRMPYPLEMIDEAYTTCLQGNDIVSVAPKHNRNLLSSVFYGLFNSGSNSKYKLKTDVFRLLSRRAINRVHSISATMPYRKAAYAACGLKMETLTFKGGAGRIKGDLRLSRAADSLALYTGIGYKIALGISVIMLLLMVAALVYTAVIYLGGGNPIEGWTTTMLLLTGGFFGVFLLLSIVLKYLSLLVEMVFKNQKYLVESVEKIT